MGPPRGGIGPGRHSGGVEGLDLAREEERAVRTPMIVERLDSETVASDEQSLLFLIPDRKDEHSKESIETCLSPAAVGGEDDFRVRLAPERVVPQFPMELAIVVDLA